jgi:hypothetical protein
LRTPFEKGEIFGVVEVVIFVGVDDVSCSGDLVKVVDVGNVVAMVGVVIVGVGVWVKSMALTSMVKRKDFLSNNL